MIFGFFDAKDKPYWSKKLGWEEVPMSYTAKILKNEFSPKFS